MTNEDHKPDRSARTRYLFVSVIAVVVICLTELQREVSFGGLVVLIAGLVGILAPQRISPLLLVTVLAISHFTEQFVWPGFEGTWHRARWSLQFADVVLCGAILAYVAAQYRLQGLCDHLLPPDPRRRAGPPRFQFSVMRWLPEIVRRRRSGKLVTADELATLVLTLPFFAAFAQLAGFLLTQPWDLSGMHPRYGRLLLLAWVSGVGLLVVAAGFDYWRRRQMTRAEALLFLQDTTWAELRREQRRAQRNFAWARLQLKRRKDNA